MSRRLTDGCLTVGFVAALVLDLSSEVIAFVKVVCGRGGAAVDSCLSLTKKNRT